jgi:hypothetical protein
MLGLFMDKVGWNIFEAKDSMAQLIPMVEQESQNTPDLHDVGQRLVNVRTTQTPWRAKEGSKQIFCCTSGFGTIHAWNWLQLSCDLSESIYYCKY